MTTAWIKVRVATEEQDRWKKASGPQGLSEMIRTVVNEHVARVEVAALDPAIPDPVKEQDRVRAEKRAQVEGLRRLMVVPPKPIPKPKSAPLDIGGRRCPDHPNILVVPGQTRCRFAGCFNRIP